MHQNAAHAFGFGSGVRTFCYVLSYDLCVDGNFMGIILTPIMSLVIRYQNQVFWGIELRFRSKFHILGSQHYQLELLSVQLDITLKIIFVAKKSFILLQREFSSVIDSHRVSQQTQVSLFFTIINDIHWIYNSEKVKNELEAKLS